LIPAHAPLQHCAPVVHEAPFALQHRPEAPHVRPGQSDGPVHPHFDPARQRGPSVAALHVLQIATTPAGASPQALGSVPGAHFEVVGSQQPRLQ
jgi:hypothetical protein